MSAIGNTPDPTRQPSTLPSLDETLQQFDQLLETDVRVSTRPHPQGETFAACQAAAKLLGLSGAAVRGSAGPDASLAEVATAMGLVAREIALTGTWWTHDHGVLLAREADSGRPVLLRSARGTSAMAVSGPGPLGRFRPLTREAAERLAPQAVALHPTLPDSPLRFAHLLKEAARLHPFEFLAYVVLTVLIALLTYAVPVASGLVVDHAVPFRSGVLLLSIVAVVVGSNLLMLALRYTCELIAQRLEAGTGVHLQAGTLDRLFRLPLRFFSSYNSADLMRRFTALEGARRTSLRMMVSSAMDISTLVVGLATLTWYFPMGALAVAVMALIALLLAWLLGRRSFAAYAQGEAMTTNVLTVVYEMVANMVPIRLFGAQRRAFLRWRDNFVEMRRRQVHSTSYGDLYAAFQQSASLLTLAVVFTIVAYAVQPNDGASVGHYVAFVGSLSLVTGAVASLANTTLGVFGLIPSVNMGAPLLAAVPEPAGGRKRLAQIQGEVELSGVNFRYADDGPWVFSNLSLRIAAGEYVGVVGPSGCGKSTLVKLMLGLLPPTHGRIAFDQSDLANLDMDRLRQQCGVVLQQCRMFPGSLLENIAAGRDLELDRVLAVLDTLGLGDYVRALPMGVHTVVGESAQAFSGGQVQLISLARALAGEPKVLIFDEPTSALDNASVERVGQAIAALPITRLVFTHRLGTLQACDRIIVLDQGRIVQEGRYDALACEPGFFQQLLTGQPE